jgi:dihydroxyacetone kinase-like predicted kinase
MREAVAAVRTGEVTIASRDTQMNGVAIRKGEWLGLVEGQPVAGGDDFETVTYSVVEKLFSEPKGGLLTLLTGKDKEPIDRILDRIAAEHPDVEVDVQDGGQPHYHLLLSAE